tara:strand:+ start:155 stop:1267 length:1113 start_codon:yes stop_codon:yes gene_type:complete
VGFPHGLGDFILCSGVFSAFRKKHPYSKIILACNLYLVTQRLVQRYNFFDLIIPMPNPWASNSGDITDIDSWFQTCEGLASNLGADRCLLIDHEATLDHTHAIDLTVNSLDLDAKKNYALKWFPVSKSEHLEAKKIKQNIIHGQKYHFIHDRSSDPKKNTAADYYTQKFSDEDLFLLNIYELQSKYNLSLGASAELLRSATKTTLVDSIFIHIAASFQLVVDNHITSNSIDVRKKPPNLSVKNRMLINEIPTILNTFARVKQKYFKYTSKKISIMRQKILQFKLFFKLKKPGVCKFDDYLISLAPYSDTLNILWFQNILFYFYNQGREHKFAFTLSNFHHFINFLVSHNYSSEEIIKIILKVTNEMEKQR